MKDELNDGELVINFKQGGSGTGVSHYLNMARCPRKARLDAQFEGGPSGQAANIGTVFHRLAELYHIGRGDLCRNVKVADDEDGPALNEGQRIFSAYRKFFPPDAWGRVVGVEQHLPGECDPDCFQKDAENKAGCACSRLGRVHALNTLFDVPLTCRIDMIVEIEDEQLAGIKARSGLELEAGRYLLDHKTADKKPYDLAVDSLYNLQFGVYLAAWNCVYPRVPVKGLIVNKVIKHKEMRLYSEGNRKPASFYAALVPPPSKERLEFIGSFLQSANTLGSTDFANMANCRQFGRTCIHRDTGECEQG